MSAVHKLALEQTDTTAPMSAADYTAQLSRAGISKLDDIERARPEDRPLFLRWCLQRYDAELIALMERTETLLAKIRSFEGAASLEEAVGRLAIDTQAFKQLCSEAVQSADRATKLQDVIARLMKPRTGIALVDHPLSAKIVSGGAALAGGGLTFIASSTLFHWIEHIFHIESSLYTSFAVMTEALATLYVAARAPSATIGRLKGWTGTLSGRRIRQEQQSIEEALIDPADDVLKDASELSRKLVEAARLLWHNVYRLRQMAREADTRAPQPSWGRLSSLPAGWKACPTPQPAPDGGEVAKAVRIAAGAAALRRCVVVKVSVADFMKAEPAHLDEFFKLIAQQLPGWIAGQPAIEATTEAPGLLGRLSRAPRLLIRQFKGFGAGLLEGAGDFGEKAKHLGEQIERAVLDMTILMAFDAIRFLAETSERMAGQRMTMHADPALKQKQSDDIFKAFTKVFLSRSLWGKGEYGRILGRSMATLAAAAIKTIPYIDAMKELMTGQGEHTPERAAESLRQKGIREMVDTSAQLMLRAVRSSALAIAHRVESRLFKTDYAGSIIEGALERTIHEKETDMDAILAQHPPLGERALSETTMPMEVLWNLHMLPSLSAEERTTLIMLIRYWDAHRTWQAARSKLSRFRHAKELDAISLAIIPNVRSTPSPPGGEGKGVRGNVESNLNRRRKLALPPGGAGRVTVLHGLPDGSLLALDARGRRPVFRLHRSVEDMLRACNGQGERVAQEIARLNILEFADVPRIRLAEHLLGPMDEEQTQALLSGRRREHAFSPDEVEQLRAARLI